VQPSGQDHDQLDPARGERGKPYGDATLGAQRTKWRHSDAIYGSVVAYGQFDAPNEERAHMTLDLTPDQLLSTTRTVRKRLDLSRPVERELVEECFELALQAPTGGNQCSEAFRVTTWG
jgi:hypothetical protein